MNILLANPRGFCAGVDRAIEIVNRALEVFGAPVYVRHEVVHNKFVVNGLRDRGAVFVDELDRCRPSYSVELLERIKHVFSVKGAVFILAVDRDQLLSSISGVYGSNIDAPRYIRKFIDWNFSLPNPSPFDYSTPKRS